MLLDGAGRDIWGESWRWRRWVFLFISLLASVYTLRLALALALDCGWVGHIKARLVEYSSCLWKRLGAMMLMIMLGSCVFASRTWC